MGPLTPCSVKRELVWYIKEYGSLSQANIMVQHKMVQGSAAKEMLLDLMMVLMWETDAEMRRSKQERVASDQKHARLGSSGSC